MLRNISIAMAFVIVLFLGAQAEAQGVAPGKPAKVTCASNPNQSYACYLPTRYNPKKQWPILYCFDPDAKGMRMVTLCRIACERYGWICVGSNNAKNGPGDIIGAATQAMFEDTHKRFSIVPNRCYSTGFSGGSGMAFFMAEGYPEQFAGVIPMACATSWAENVPDIATHISVFFITGDSDSVAHVKRTADALKAKGNKTEMKTFPGGHELPPASVVIDAVKWMENNKPEEPEEKPWEVGLPVTIRLKSSLCKRLQPAIRKGLNGDIGEALGIAQKLLDDEKATEEEKKEAQYVKERVEKRAKELLSGVEQLLSDKLVYEATELLDKIGKALSGMKESGQAKEKMKELKCDESLKNEFAAGRIFAKASEYERKGRNDKAGKYLRQVIDKYPETEYAKKAKKKVDNK